jgi:hypothetical protein
MKRTAGAVLLAAAAVMAILLFLLSAALPPSAAESRRPYYPLVPFETHLITLRAPPNAGAMDEDAHRRWHESFLPSTVVADYYGDEPRLLLQVRQVRDLRLRREAQLRRGRVCGQEARRPGIASLLSDRAHS